MRKPNGYWNLQTLTESAKGFDTIAAWSKAEMGAYLAARRKGLIQQVTQHMLSHAESISRARRTWTRESCLASAKKFTKRFDWEKGEPNAYLASKRYGWYEECVAHMHRVKAVNGFWDMQQCLLEARKYPNITTWLQANASSYQAAKSNPEWFAECTAHMERLWEKKWSKESILADAKKYPTIQEWSRNSSGAYSACLKKGLLKEATAHMEHTPKWYGVSHIIRILQSFDLEYEEEKTFEDCRDQRKLPFDFYVPSAKLLIEHHGTQHQRGWQGRGAAAIERRDEIKRRYAMANGFAYLEIKEWETSEPAEVESIIRLKLEEIEPCVQLIKRELSEDQIAKTRVRSKFDLVTLQAIAYAYVTRAELKRGNEPAYNFACRHGLINQICGHMLTKGEAQGRALTKWTKERVLESAKRFKTSREWCANEGGAYNAALKNGWLKEASKHFPKGKD